MSIRRTLAALALALVVPAAAHAATAFSTVGPHVGFSSDPSQIVLGGQLQLGDVAPQVDFVPGADLGFGDHATVISLNGDFHYRFEISGTQWQPYAGAGISLHFISWDTGVIGHSSDTVGGGSIILGADVPTKTGSRFFTEAKFGLGDGPTFKALAGWHFKMH
jgi:hypothetical protein